MESVALGIDTAETYAYKLAHQNNRPLSSIIVNNMVSMNPVYTDVHDIVVKSIVEGHSLADVNLYLTKLTRRDMWRTVVDIAAEQFLVSKNLTLQTIKLNDVKEFMKMTAQIRRDSVKLDAYLSVFVNRVKHQRREKSKEMVRIADMITKLHETQTRYTEAVAKKPFTISALTPLSEDLQYVVQSEHSSEQGSEQGSEYSSEYSSDDILSIFDSAIVSDTVRHIVCNTRSGVYQKMFTPGPLDRQTTKEMLVNARVEMNTIMFNVRSSKDSIHQFVISVVYAIDTGYMSADVNSKYKEEFLETMGNTFPTLAYKTETSRVKYTLKLYPRQTYSFNAMFHYLLHMTTVSPEMYQFYLNESTSAFPKKTQLKFRYRPFWQVSTKAFTPIKGTKGVAGVKDESSFILNVYKTIEGGNYIDVEITSLNINYVYRLLSSLIPTLCMYYIDHIEGISPLAELYNIPRLIVEKKGVASRIKEELSIKWPSIFPAAYLKTTDAKFLVITTSDKNEAKAWKKQSIIGNKTKTQRQVLPFPKEEDGPALFYFTSARPDAPNIGYVPNPNTDAKYDYIPHSSASRTKTKTDTMNKANRGNAVSLDALGEDSYSVPFEILNTILGFDVVRRGVYIDSNSFARIIANIIIAGTGDSIHKQTKIALGIRARLATFNTELYKQSLYDISNEEILQYLEDDTQFLDPLLVKTGMEEFTGLDIYIIRAAVRVNVTTYTLETPRHAKMYCDYKQRRKCIVILLNHGLVANRLKHPHCEILVPFGDENILNAIYSVEVSERLHNIMKNSNRALSFTNTNIYISQSMNSGMLNVLDRMTDYGVVVSQYIDTYGKARAFTVESDGVMRTILFYPCAPINAPHSDIIHETSVEWLTDFCHNEPHSRSVIGVYCEDETTKEMLYVRTRDIPEDIETLAWDPFGDVYLDTARDVNTGKEIAQQDKLARVLRELFRWIFEVYSSHATPNAKEFASKHLTHIDAEESNYYNISTINSKLPSANNMKQVIEFIVKHSIIPVSGQKLVIHSKSYYNSVLYMLGKHQIVLYSNPPIRRSIYDFYISPYDFTERQKTVVFLSTDAGAADNSLLLSTTGTPHQDFMTSINPSDLAEGRHIFYLHGSACNSHILYAIQPTLFNDMKAAYTVSFVWITEGRNIGVDISSLEAVEDQYDMMTAEYVVYTIYLGDIVPVEHTNASKDVSDTDRVYIEILEYTPGKYAALLRL